ncbi:MAG: DUF6456 domain-containing protein [Proteobacteria bacterium]|nr:DUF6456 domain-containing protein [Pseudomonadota bacterium]
MKAPSEIEAEYRRMGQRLLRRLAQPGSSVEKKGDELIFYGARKAIATACGMPSGVLAGLLESGVVKCVSQQGKTRFSITPEGLARLRRENAEEDPFASQHRLLAQAQPEPTSEAAPTRINLREDPLEMLRRAGILPALIGAAEIEAGMRLRRDCYLAGSAPQMGVNWSRLAVDNSCRHDGLTLSEGAMAAKARVDRAMRSVGPDFAGILWDICAFSKGLESIERDYAIPLRSGKVILAYALRALARHYGLRNAATGPERSPMRQWHDEEAATRRFGA